MFTKFAKLVLLIGILLSSTLPMVACKRTTIENNAVQYIQRTSPANNSLCSGNCRLP